MDTPRMFPKHFAQKTHNKSTRGRFDLDSADSFCITLAAGSIIFSLGAVEAASFPGCCRNQRRRVSLSIRILPSEWIHRLGKRAVFQFHVNPCKPFSLLLFFSYRDKIRASLVQTHFCSLMFNYF